MTFDEEVDHLQGRIHTHASERTSYNSRHHQEACSRHGQLVLLIIIDFVNLSSFIHFFQVCTVIVDFCTCCVEVYLDASFGHG